MSDLGGVRGFYDFKESSKMLKDNNLTDRTSKGSPEASEILTVSLMTLKNREFHKISNRLTTTCYNPCLDRGMTVAKR